MKRFFEWLDSLVGVTDESGLACWLDRTTFVFVTLMVVFSPLSIAASQASWIIGLLLTVIRFFFTPRPRLRFNPLHIAFWCFFGWAVISSVMSYAPDISIDKLRSVSLFTVFYLLIANVRTIRAVHFLAFAMVLSCMVNVIWTPVERILGRGVEVHGLAPDGPLARANVAEGDTLLLLDGKKIHAPEDITTRIDQAGTAKVTVYKLDYTIDTDIKSADLPPAGDAGTRLGFTSWRRSHNWRSQGFFSHFTIYAGLLQIIASLTLGLLLAVFRRKYILYEPVLGDDLKSRFWLDSPGFLIAALAGLCLALILTVTRASQLGFAISAFTMVLFGAGRKWLLRATIVAVPLVAIGLFTLQYTRQVGFFDQSDNSITWRETVWQEGFDLWTSSPRNFIFGIGMDSIKRYAAEWHLFDDGRLPAGHFHSTPLQLAYERGLPELVLWIVILLLYLRVLLKALRDDPRVDWRTFGVLLGSLGAFVGFVAAGMVHFNLSGEVAMAFYLVMGFGYRTATIIAGEQVLADP